MCQIFHLNVVHNKYHCNSMVIKMDDEQLTSIKKFSNWIETNEKKLNTACHCTPKQSGHQGWKHVIEYHENIQSEVENLGKQLCGEVRRQLNEDKSSQQDLWDEAEDLEKRWHNLWLKSLEQLVVVERTKRCPKHNSTIIGKPTQTSIANKSIAKSHRRRPISYPNNVSERLEWDYQNTLSLTGCHKENGSQIDLDSVDEQVTKNLTEFGENYELWFGKEDEVACVALHSRPPSCEPTEQPEIAKAIVTSNTSYSNDVNCNLLMLTTPSSMLSVDASKYCSHNDQKRQNSSLWRYFCPIVLLFVLVLFSTLYKEPHQVQQNYQNSRPPT